MINRPETHGEVRGSQKLLASLPKNNEVPDTDQIKKAFKLDKIEGLKLQSWHNRGIPAWFELLTTIETPIASLNEVVSRVVELNDSSLGLKILINGIPVPDWATVVVSNEKVG